MGNSGVCYFTIVQQRAADISTLMQIQHFREQNQQSMTVRLTFSASVSSQGPVVSEGSKLRGYSDFLASFQQFYGVVVEAVVDSDSKMNRKLETHRHVSPEVPPCPPNVEEQQKNNQQQKTNRGNRCDQRKEVI